MSTGTQRPGYELEFDDDFDHGVLPWNDPGLTDERYHDWLPIDASEYHVYGIDWTPEHVDFFIDEEHVRRVGQSPQ